jgi:hypothetical protein
MESEGWEVISVYTRAQAIEDGVLALVPPTTPTPFKVPVAITAPLWAEIERGVGKNMPVLNARIWDVCCAAAQAAVRAPDGETDVFFRVKVGRAVLHLWSNCGPDDDGSPCITLGFPEDR